MADGKEHSWHHREMQSSTGQHHGLSIADTLDEIKAFAFACFDRLDENKDGFVTRDELKHALDNSKTDWRSKSFISFLLRRIDDIKDAYEEEWAPNHEGISRADIQEYFHELKSKV